MFGFLCLNKPSSMTSRAVVDRVERLVPRRFKVGHSGTLDPLATGVLVLAIGPATRLVPRVHEFPKTYLAEFQLGLRSDTDDITGEVTTVVDPPVIEASDIDVHLQPFRGAISQMPPQHSAIKVNGRRAYDMARAGEAVALKPRNVIVHRLQRRDFQWPRLVVEIECSSGTYVRSIGRDLGERLGTGAVMTGLVRTAVGPFRIEDAIHPQDLNRCQIVRSLVDPLAAAPGHHPVVLSNLEVESVRHGKEIPIETSRLPPGIESVAVVDEARRAIALGQLAADTHRFRPELVFESF